MKNKIKIIYFLLSSYLILSACVVQEPASEAKSEIVSTRFHEIDLEKCEVIKSNSNMSAHIQGFSFLIDPSASMTEIYQPSQVCENCHDNFIERTYAVDHIEINQGKEVKDKALITAETCAECHQDYSYENSEFSLKLARCINKSIPNYSFISELKTFGAPVYSRSEFGPKKYSRKDFDTAIRGIGEAEGSSPLSFALDQISKDWYGILSEGADANDSTIKQRVDGDKAAILLVSDGKGMGIKSLISAESLEARYKNRICFHTIQIGNDEEATEFLQSLSEIGHCGTYQNGDDFLNPVFMESFINRVFSQRKVTN